MLAAKAYVIKLKSFFFIFALVKFLNDYSSPVSLRHRKQFYKKIAVFSRTEHWYRKSSPP